LLHRILVLHFPAFSQKLLFQAYGYGMHVDDVIMTQLKSHSTSSWTSLAKVHVH